MKIRASNKPDFFELDEEDLPLLGSSSWRMDDKGYVKRTVPNGRGGRTTECLHRLIIGAPPGSDVDHINGNPSDNRRANLRACSRAENVRNSRKANRPRSSEYKGVRELPSGRWAVFVGPRNTDRYVGSFDTELEAANAYDKEAIARFGPYAKLNFPSRDE